MSIWHTGHFYVLLGGSLWEFYHQFLDAGNMVMVIGYFSFAGVFSKKINLVICHQNIYFSIKIEKMGAKTTIPVSARNIRSTMRADIDNHGSLGREIKLGVKTHVTLNKPGRETAWFVPTVDVLIGIGKDHSAQLTMDTDAWEALKRGDKISVNTLQQYQKQFVNHSAKKKKNVPRRKSKMAG